MFGSNLKLAMRHLTANKLFSLINVLGLALAIACSLLIALFVRYELSFDKFHPDADRIYRLSLDFDNGGYYWASNASFLVPLIKTSLPEIEAATRLTTFNAAVGSADAAFDEAGLRLVDPEFFQLFKFDWRQGQADSALAAPFSLVITESMAQKYFGAAEALGQTLTLNGQFELTVNGIIADLPGNTHLSGDLFTSFATLNAIMGGESSETNLEAHSYIRLAPGADVADITAQLNATLSSRLEDRLQGRTAIRADRVGDVHFNSLQNELPGKPGSLLLLYIFSGIAACILLIACINFTNLTVARASRRAREIGVRKVVGARREQLVYQFMGESVLLTMAALCLALMLVEVAAPALAAFTGKGIAFDLLENGGLLAALVGLSILVGALAGVYPALYLTRQQPVEILKGHSGSERVGFVVRNLLVISQFAASIVMIIATLVMYAQVNYGKNFDPGYSDDNVVIVRGSGIQGLGPQWEAIKQELAGYAGIEGVTASSVEPASQNTDAANFWYEGGTSDLLLPTMSVDFDYFSTLDIDLLEGRDFDTSRASDRMRGPIAINPEGGAAYILSEQAARQLGWSADEAIGKTIAVGGVRGAVGPVIGVVENVYYESIRNAQKPIVYFAGNGLSHVAIRVNGNNLQQTLDYIDATFKRFMPDQPVARSFLQQNVESLYLTETQHARLLTLFALFAVFISCLGLHGLAAFNAERRVKEIGVRKVMGGSILSIVVLLTSDFSRLVLISNLIAWPVAWFAMDRWLENFAYRIDLTPLIFIGSGAIVLCIAWVTVGGTAAKAASAKPVLALRHE